MGAPFQKGDLATIWVQPGSVVEILGPTKIRRGVYRYKVKYHVWAEDMEGTLVNRDTAGYRPAPQWVAADQMEPIVEEPMVMNPDEDDGPDWLYHVTYAVNLDGIGNIGLVPGAGTSMGGGGNVAHSMGKVFITEPEGVSFWFGRAQEWADHNSDDPLDDGLVPVVLRVDMDEAEDKHWEDDAAGTRDSGEGAYAYRAGIPPEDIQLWNGNAWVSIDPNADAYELAVMAYDDEGDQLDDYSNPLFPDLR